MGAWTLRAGFRSIGLASATYRYIGFRVSGSSGKKNTTEPSNQVCLRYPTGPVLCSQVRLLRALACWGRGPQQRGETVADVVEADAQLAKEHARQERLRSSVLFPTSWQTADMKHVVDNLLHECLEAMTTSAATARSLFLLLWGS